MLESSMIVATVPVTDLDRAKRFYADTLGLKVLWENPASVRLGCGGGAELSNFRRAPSTADPTLAHFEVADIEAVGGGPEKRRGKVIRYWDGPLPAPDPPPPVRPAPGGGLPRP